MQGVRYYHHLLEQYHMGLMAARRGYQAKAHSGLSDLLASHQDRVFRSVATGSVATSQMLFGKNSPERTERWCTFVLGQLDHPECQRILFDSAQASLFTELGAAPEAEMLRLVHPPFARTYIEFTHPIACASNEPGYREELQALFVRELTHLERMEMMTTTPVLGATGSGSTGPSPQLPVDDPTRVVQVAAFIKSYKQLPPEECTHDPEQIAERLTWTDRWWLVDLNTGGAFTRAGNLIAGGTDLSELPEGIDPLHFVVVGAPFPEAMVEGYDEVPHAAMRRCGWYERTVSDHTALLLWVLTFLLAKSVRVVPEPISRQVRRHAERTNTPLPKPWHVVLIQPRVGSSKAAVGVGSPHRYRYDVIGHLRLNRHRTRQGVREVVEWVPPHQRGVDQKLYIPKQYKVEHGAAVPAALVRKYFGQG